MKKSFFKFKFISLSCVFLMTLSVFTPSISIKAATNNLPTLICIDTPQNNSNQNANMINLEGWSLSGSGVKSVQVAVDGKNNKNASIGIARTDVARAYPGYSGASNSGFNLSLDASQLSNGAHKITVTSTGNDGSTKSQDVNISKVTANGTALVGAICIDTPISNSNVFSLNNTVNIAGWSLDGYGVQKVQVYVDNIYRGDASIGASRTDVAKYYSQYSGSATSGYNYSLDTSSISDGVHTITVKSTGNTGIVLSSNISVNKVSSQTMPPHICIDTPQDNSKQNESQISIVGWSLSLNGVKSVQVAVDGQNNQSANIGLSRTDVARIFPGYNGAANSGYSLNLDVSQLSNGVHKITVTSTGNDGSTKSQDVNIYKVPADGKDLAGAICIDTPLSNSNVSSLNNKVNIAGWSLDGYGVQKVQVYVDNSYRGDASIGASRTDVAKYYSQYSGSATSGYNYSLDTSSISDGVHTITIKSIGNTGAVSSSSVNVKKVSSQTMPPIVYIDYPSYSQVNSNKINITGWALDLYGIAKVQVYVDNTYKGDANIGILRPDVNNAYPGYLGGTDSGYSYNLDITSLSSGVHTVIVKSIGNDGSVTNQNTSVYKLSTGISSMDSKIYLDTPSDGAFYKNQPGQVNVEGWSLNAFGVQKVQVYFDNSYKGDANIGLVRVDVNNAFPGYLGGSNSGFSYNLNLSNISDGAHSISVRSIGNDGNVEIQNLKLYKFSSNGQSTLYNLSLQSMVDNQMQNGQPQMQSGNSWVNADRNTVQYYSDPMNFMDNYGIYQFLRLDYMQGVTADDLNRILVGKGVLAGKGAQFLAAAQQSNINPIYLVSHTLLETGNGTSTLSSGTILVNGQHTFNLFGIGAYDSDPLLYGSQYAYSQGWFTVDAAIYGGANWISTQYINNSTYKQNTLYKMRWNPASPANHQYATDVRWAYNQITNMKKLTDMVTNPVLQFDIPQYK